MCDLTPQIADPQHAAFGMDPIKQTHLLEASAGTGKTYSIQTLYLRLILVEQLTVQQILVVTFTKDATKELREKLQGVLRAALDHASGAVTIDDPKDRTRMVVDAAINLYKSDSVQSLLKIALLDFDTASVYTIHGFCQRVLSRFAFETRQPFDLDLTGETTDKVEALCRDWWRKNVYGMDEAAGRIISACKHFNLGTIQKIAKKLIAKPDAILLPETAGPAAGQNTNASLQDTLIQTMRAFGQKPSDANEKMDCETLPKFIQQPFRDLLALLQNVRACIEHKKWGQAFDSLTQAVQFQKSPDCPDDVAVLSQTLNTACINLCQQIRPRTQARTFRYDDDGYLSHPTHPDLTPEFTNNILNAARALDAVEQSVIPASMVARVKKGPTAGQPTKTYKAYRIVVKRLGVEADNVSAGDLYNAVKDLQNPQDILLNNATVKVDYINPAFRQLYNDLIETCRQEVVKAVLEIRKQYQEHRAADDTMSYDDLLLNLRSALTQNNQTLQDVLRREFRAALIDEFQDTDPVQWQIFNTLFNNQALPFVLVGDPKQAIYRFRNGDIETYLHATQGIESRHPLQKNFRSETRLIDAVNQIFMDDGEKKTFGEGIPYEGPLAARGKNKDESLLVHDKPDQKPFKILLIDHDGSAPPGRSNGTARDIYRSTAKEIARILNDKDLKLDGKPVRKQDIAVLVTKHKEAASIANELRELGIAAVRQGVRNVWQTDEGRLLLAILEAVLNSRDGWRVRRALITPWCGVTYEQIPELLAGHKVRVKINGQDCDYGLEDWVTVFDDLRETWGKRGFPAMFQKLMNRFDLKTKLLGAQDGQGQRRLTNLGHLAEGVERQQTVERKPPDGVLAWIRRQLDRSTADGGDEYLLRMETDDDAVRIMTIFASKGLQFPIVFAPTLCMIKNHSSDPFYEYHDQDGKLCLAIKKDGKQDKESKEKVNEEIKREQVRKIYVALTRAVHRTVVFELNNFKKPENKKDPYSPISILGKVLRLPIKEIEVQGEKNAIVDLDRIDKFYSRPEKVPCAIEVQKVDTSDAPKPEAAKSEPLHKPGEKPKPDLTRGHGSFSSLAPREQQETVEQVPVPADTSAEKNRDGETAVQLSVRDDEKPEGIFAFPSGAKTGTCWHEIFEDIAFNAKDADIDAMVAEKLEIHGFLKKTQAKDERIAFTTTMVKQVLQTALPVFNGAKVFALKDIAADDRKTEWEFSFSTLTEKRTTALKTAIEMFPEYKPFTQELREWDREIPGGFLTGFVDLLFRKDGRYYIVDWKSNRRNSRQDGFDQEGLKEEISLHRYWLQFLIYSVAVHQYLSKALPDYKYETNYGGVYYIFLRGVDGNKDGQGNTNGIYANRPPKALIDQLSKILGDFA